MCDKSTAFPVFPRRSTRMDVLLRHDLVVDRSSSSSPSSNSSPSGRSTCTTTRVREEGTGGTTEEERGAAGNHLVVLQAPPRGTTATGLPRHMFSELPNAFYHHDGDVFAGSNTMSNDRHHDDSASHHHCMLLATIDRALEILGMYEDDDVDNDFGDDMVVDRVVRPQ